MNRKLLTLLAFIISVTFLSQNAFSQRGDNNMYLLANLNEHPVPSGFGAPWDYAACWGYVAPDGREYAIMGAVLGTSFIDITDSLNIQEVSFFPSQDSTQGQLWKEMKVYSHYAYVVSEAQNSALDIYDLQYLPDSVHFVKKFVAPGHSSTHSISQSGPYLYLNGANNSFGHGTVVFDLSDPENPVVRGAWNTRYVHDCRIIDDTIYAMNINSGDGQITIIDATNKDSLKFVNDWLNLPNPSPHNCALTTDKKYLYATDETGPLPRLLKIWDIQDIFNPTQVNTWQPEGITTARIHNVEIYGDTAVIAHYTAGVYVLNIADPVNPTVIGYYDTHPEGNDGSFAGCWGVYKFPSGKIIGSDMNRGLFVLKIGTTVGINNNSQLLEGYSLSQNYPNPFNPSTVISFTIPKNSEVSLKIFDAKGSEVAQVLNDRRDGGTYNVTLDASRYGLTSGVYFYKLIAGDFTETKKMLLIK